MRLRNPSCQYLVMTSLPVLASHAYGGGRVVRRCWVKFQCRGVLLIWIIVGQGPNALAIGAGGGCLDIFYLNYHFSFLSPSLWETARYSLKGPLNPEQPTNQPNLMHISTMIYSHQIILKLVKLSFKIIFYKK